MSDFLYAIIAGIIEGVTEFLPISSTGHLIIFSHYSEYNLKKKEAFEMIIQLAAILSIVIIYKERVKGLFVFSSNNGFSGFKAWKLLVIVSLPTLILGYLLKDFIRPFKPEVALIGLVVGAVIMLLVERFKPESKVSSLDDLTLKLALCVGVAQCFSLLTGMSRSAMTISGGLVFGMSRKLAAEFSFIAALPIMVAVTVYEVYELFFAQTRTTFVLHDLYIFLIGFIISFIVSYYVVKLFLKFVENYSLNVFAYYRLLIAPVFYYIIFYTKIFS